MTQTIEAYKQAENQSITNHPDWHKVAGEFYEIEQIIGKALGYPKYSDDKVNFPLSDNDDVCTGEHTPVTLAMEIAKQYEQANFPANTALVQKLVDALNMLSVSDDGLYVYVRRSVNPKYFGGMDGDIPFAYRHPMEGHKDVSDAIIAGTKREEALTEAEAYLKQEGKASEGVGGLPIEAMVKAALDNHCQLLTDIFMHLPTEVIDDDRHRVAAGFIGAVVRTCVIAARQNLSNQHPLAQQGKCAEYRPLGELPIDNNPCVCGSKDLAHCLFNSIPKDCYLNKPTTSQQEARDIK